MREHRTLPDLPKGYQLDPYGDWISIVIPEETVNLFTNPSFETTTNRGFGVGAGSSVAQSSVYQRFGAYSLLINPGNSGVGGGGESIVLLQTATVYTISAWVLDPIGRSLRAVFYDQVASAEIGAVTFRPQPGMWTRVVVTALTRSTGTHDLRILSNGSTNTAAFYIDGLQCEQKAYVTTYVDGDQVGFVPTRADMYWSGLIHSSTSVRIAQCRAGGREVKLSAFGFVLLAIVGLGMAPVDNVFLPLGFQGGESYQRTLYAKRTFSLLGDMRGDKVDFAQRMGKLMEALRFDIVDPPQPLMLKYQRIEERTQTPISEECYIPCVLDQGPGNLIDNLYGEAVELRFSQERLPTISNLGEYGSVLDFQDSSTLSYVARRNTNGAWYNFGTGANFFIYDMAYAPDGGLYIVGGFTGFNGVAHNRIVKIEPDGTIVAIGTGANGTIRSVCVAAGGRVYVTGDFTQFNTGPVAANRIGYFEAGAWNAMGTGLNGNGYKIRMDRDNLPIVTGDFTTANGVTVNRIAKWTGATFAAYGTGANIGVNNRARALAIRDSDGAIFVGGDLTGTGGGGTVFSYVAAWINGAWSTLAGGIASPVDDIKIAPNGDVYLAASLPSIARWNGIAWTTIASLYTEYITSLCFDNSGVLWLGFYNVTTRNSGLYRYNGSTFIPADIKLSTAGGDNAVPLVIVCGRDGTITTGGYDFGLGGFTLTAQYAGLTTITNPGDANTYPVLEFTGPGVLTSVRNVTTGKEITFTGLTLVAGERAYLRLDPTNIRFFSNFRSNLATYINRGSQEAEFYLVGRSASNPTGANIIAIYIAETTAGTTSAMIHYHPRYQSLHSLVYR